MPARLPTAQYFKQIRTWEGRQTRAFEELCFQLRDREPDNVELRKTSDPDGGLEWYWVSPDGSEVGWQCKFTDNERSLMSMMAASFESVRQRRPNARRLTFCIAVDLSDDPDGSRGELGWQRFERLREKWKKKAPRLEVRVVLGGELLDRLALEEHRGREWFWFARTPILHPDWCRTQRDIAIDSAAERYRPDINVDLLVDATVAAVAQPERLRTHFDQLVGFASKRAAEALENRPTEGPFAEPRERLGDAARTLLEVAHEPWTPQSPLSDDFDRALAEFQKQTDSLLNAAYEQANEASTALQKDANDEQARARLDRSYHHERDGHRLEVSLLELSEWTNGPARAAAESAFLLLDGEGGAGKTHLFCDVAGHLIDGGHPVLLLLGQWFGSDSPWKTLAERIGGPDLSIDEVVVALEASAEASNTRMVLMVDAINDAGDVGIWQKHLHELRTRLTRSRWIGVALSCRTTYLDALTPRGGLGSRIARATHPGFAGREFEAIERIFSAYGVAEPRVPLLLPELTNPLFLILYSDSIARRRVPLSGAAHLSAIFDAFVEGRKHDITRALGLDPALDPVGKAMRAITAEITRRARDHLPYEQASEIVGEIDTSGGRWPDNLFGRMLSEGLLTKDYAYLRDEGHQGEAIRFPFQRFSDHLIVGGLLDAYLDTDDPGRSFSRGEPLHGVITEGPLGTLEALAVQLPERSGAELPDIAIAADIPEWRKHRALRAFVESVPARDPRAAERDRVIPLLNMALAIGLIDEVTGALIACAPLADHPLNGEWLHGYLNDQPLPQRDAGWMQMTYWAHGETTHPLDRLIRWAERGPYPDYDAAVLELAAIPLAWALASPNRFARDAATKSLTTLFAGRVMLAERLVRRFLANDDPYVTERLAAAAYGALLRHDTEAPAATEVGALLHALVEMLEQARPNVLMRDHVAGVARYMQDRLHQEVPDDLIERALPPYGSGPPEAPRELEDLEQTYARRGPNDEIGYGAVEHSLFTDFGDFHKYVMSGCARSFQRDRLCSPQPSPAPPRERWRTQYPGELAARFIFERVVELGWTPERFGAFDVSASRADRGRDSHKPERFGKKYQWIGLFELLARLADNHVFTGRWGDEPQLYEGAWQLSVRDIDPSLPPARVRVIAEERSRDPVFAVEPADAWWVPRGPDFDRASADSGRWAERMDDLPPVEELFRRRDIDGTQWVVLDGRLEYEEDRDPIEAESMPRRDLGFGMHAALVRLSDLEPLRAWFDAKADVMRSLPGWDIPSRGESYLGEVPWAPAAQELDTGWLVDEYRNEPDFPEESLEVAVPWHWPAGFDCSLDGAVNVTLPSPQVIRRGGLRRDTDTPSWSTDGGMVVRFVETDEGWNRDCALLAREDWLLELLAREELAFVAGSYAERRVLGADMFSRQVFGWVDLGAGALVANGEWTLSGYDMLWDHRSGKDPG